jgi:hypothetical protein
MPPAFHFPEDEAPPSDLVSGNVYPTYSVFQHSFCHLVPAPVVLLNNRKFYLREFSTEISVPVFEEIFFYIP